MVRKRSSWALLPPLLLGPRPCDGRVAHAVADGYVPWLGASASSGHLNLTLCLSFWTQKFKLACRARKSQHLSRSLARGPRFEAPKALLSQPWSSCFHSSSTVMAFRGEGWKVI